MDLGDYFHLDAEARRIVRTEQAKRQKRQLWRCPKCAEEMETLASEVGHRCPENRNRMTYWEVVGEMD